MELSCPGMFMKASSEFVAGKLRPPAAMAGNVACIKHSQLPHEREAREATRKPPCQSRMKSSGDCVALEAMPAGGQ